MARRLTALRKLRRRPVDGLVWVTSAFDQLSAPGLDQPLPVPSENTMDSLSHAISSRMDVLGWQLPLYVWSLHPRAGKPEGRIVQATGCLLPAGCRTEGLAEQLAALTPELTSQGLQQTCGEVKHNFLLSLADQLIREPESVTAPLSVMLNPYRPLPLAGVVFSQPSADAGRAVPHHWGMDKRWDVVPESVRTLPAGLRPRQPGIPWCKVCASVVALAMVGWAAWMGIAYVTNRSQIDGANAQATLAARQDQPPEQRLHALFALQKTLARLQYRKEHGVPWYEQAGLSQNNALLAVLWPRYQDSALPLLRDAAADHLLQQISTFNALPPGSPLREQRAKITWEQLKLYLMLARPEHMDAAWFSSALLHDWPGREGVKDSVWQGMAPSLLSFYGAQLKTHPEWKLRADEGMVSQARALLVRLMGVRNSEATQYRKMLSQVAHLYADMRLEDMTGDTDASRLFSTTEIVPGKFTRQAWEQAVQPAIEKMVKARRDELDWVLTDSRRQAKTPDENSPEALKMRLTARYFADFGGAWLAFLNSLRWKRAATLSDSIDQLILLADVRQSPLLALMNTLNTQGRTGQTGEAISDTLVKSAKNLLSGDSKDAIDQRAGARGPLDATFGPVLALMDKNRTGTQALSLQSYLTRVTQVRLRLQQVTSAADPQAMARTLAQTVFEGKAVDLTETRDYGSLIAAGLGQEWSGFGRTVFVNPMEQAWQQVLTPAAGSLNTQWQQAVVAEWNRAFGGRYPFNDSSSDVSLPLLAKYLNADSGRIARFLQTRLKGVLHKEGYGVESPLPTHYIDDIARRRDGYEATTDFLDIFNHRLIAQYYRIWRKYSYPATFEAGGKDNTSQYLLGLAGLGIDGCAQNIATPASRFLALLPVMVLPGRTAEGLASLVRLLAPGTQAKIWHHDKRRVPLKRPLIMSVRQPVTLTSRPVMGNYATDVNSQVLMRLTTTDPAEVQGWLPGGELHTDLMALLHVYLGSRLDVRLQLCVARSLLPDATMDSKPRARAVQLGRTAVMRPLNPANAATHPKTITINLGRYERVQENIHRRETDEDGDYHW
ncbi:TPA: type VI secretion system baseplate subunit TssG [Klebsiella aerogenes]|nr:type VI secretion system baseplate subunit TssG [Klebsiella aerogenes]